MNLKKSFMGLVLVAAVVSSMMLAADAAASQTASGTFGWGQTSTSHWTLADDTVTITGGIAVNPDGDVFGNVLTFAQRERITTINIVGDIAASGRMWGIFGGNNFPNLTAINGLERIDTSNVTDMRFIFGQRITELDLTGWDTGALAEYGMVDMFGGMPSLSVVTFGKNFVVSGSDANQLPWGDWLNLRNEERLRGAELWEHLRTPRDYDDIWLRTDIITAWGTFGESGGTARWFSDGTTVTVRGGSALNPDSNAFGWLNREAVTTINIVGDIIATGRMDSTFRDFVNLTAINGIEKIDTAGVTNMNFMFENASSLTELDLSGWDTGSVTEMHYMFTNMTSLKQISFGMDFVSIGNNSIPITNWQNTDTGEIKTASELWRFLSNPREYLSVWVRTYESVTSPAPTPTATPVPTPTPPSIPGDLNNSGGLDQEDATDLRRILAGQKPMPPGANADFNDDGAVNIIDLTALRLYLADR